MSYCVRGRELLLDLQRSDFLPPWDEEGVRTVATEIVDMYEKMTNRNDDGYLVNDAYYGLCMIRNRRYLSSYISNRLKKISSLRWEIGTVLPEALRQDTLSQREQDFYRQYCDILGEYNEQIGLDDIGFDLSLDLEPPKDLFIEVRALEDCGEIATENGPLNLSKGQTLFLRRTDIELLIRQGKVKQVDSGDGN